MLTLPFDSRSLCLSLLGGVILLGSLLAVSQAQVTTTITPDGTLGTAVAQDGNVFDITGGTRPGNGPNLFHSFDRFTVGAGDTAHFRGPAEIEHILSRVTGGQASTIDGILRSDISGATLFLLNPSGVLFGPNARLEVQGSFHVSTADILRLADGGVFAASFGEASRLTVAPPAAFGFLHASPAPITIQGSRFRVPDGATLSAVGGDLTIVRGRLEASGGQLHLASVASPGEVRLQATAAASPRQFAGGGVVTLVDNTRLTTTGSSGGAVFIRGGQLLISDTNITTDTEGAGNAGNIDMQMDQLVVSAGTLISASALEGSSGNGGTIRLTATGSVRIEDSRFRSSTFLNTTGHAGSIRIDAATLTLEDGRLLSRTRAAGNSGTIVIRAETVRLTDDGRIQTTASTGSLGNAGTVQIEAVRLTLEGSSRIVSVTGGPGEGGAIIITVQRLDVTDGGRIATSQTAQGERERGLTSSGNAGTIRIRATESVTVQDRRSRIGSSTGGTGDGGQIEMQVGRLTVANGGRIFSNTSERRTGDAGNAGTVRITATGAVIVTGNDSELTSTTGGNGQAGEIRITAEQIAVLDGGLISTSAEAGSSGNAGTVQLTVRASVRLDGEASTIESRTFRNSTGNAGTVQIDAPAVTMMHDSVLRSVTAGTGHAGTIRIRAEEVALKSGTQLQTTAFSRSTGNAGIVQIEATNLTLEGASRITSVTGGPGQGGEITITVPRLSITEDSFISTSQTAGGTAFDRVPSGSAGTIRINAMESLTVRGDRSRILSFTRGTGNAGTIDIQAGQLTLAAGGRVFTDSREGAAGNAGTIRIAAMESITITGQETGLFTNSASSGTGGDITIQARNIRLADGGTVSAESSASGDAG